MFSLLDDEDSMEGGGEVVAGLASQSHFFKFAFSLLLDRGSIDLNGAQEKEGHFHYKNFLRASK